MKTSAPRSASFSVPSKHAALVFSAIHASDGFRSSRLVEMTPSTSATHDVLGPCLDQQPHDRGARRTRAGHHDPHAVDGLVDDAQRVRERRQHHDRGAVLVVVEHGDVEQLTQPRLDLEAARRRDVLEVDAGEHRSDHLDGTHDLVDVLGVEAQRPGVDARRTA